MSLSSTSNLSSSSFAEFAQNVSDNERSSDNGSVSNSDADSEPEMQEDNILETVDNVVPENQEFERIGPSKDTAIVSCQRINTSKYNTIIHVIIICSYMCRVFVILIAII